MSQPIAIIDDDESIRDSLSILLSALGYPSVSYPDGEAFLKDGVTQTLLCVFMDVRMPGRDGIEILSILKQKRPDLPIIIISGHGDIPMAVRALKKGALDFLEKPFKPDGIKAILNHVETIAKSKPKTEPAPNDANRHLSKLTPREYEIALLLSDGHLNKIIAHKLNISVRTVETHRARIMSKLEITSISALVRLVINVTE